MLAARRSAGFRCGRDVERAFGQRAELVDGRTGDQSPVQQIVRIRESISPITSRATSRRAAYFSLLRPLSEAEIARRFAQHPAIFPVFRSCNRAFRQRRRARAETGAAIARNAGSSSWLWRPSGKSATYRDFRPDMLDDEAQNDGFAELAGCANHKPFECVGETAESAAFMDFSPAATDGGATRSSPVAADFPSLRARRSTDFARSVRRASARVPDEYLANARCGRLTRHGASGHLGPRPRRPGGDRFHPRALTRDLPLLSLDDAEDAPRHRAGREYRVRLRPSGDRAAPSTTSTSSSNRPASASIAAEIGLARKNGVAVTSLLNLWFAEGIEVKTICVTGTKGKSTTASLIAHILGRLGRRVALAGNIGVAGHRDRPAQGRLRRHRGVELPGGGFRRGLRHRGADLAVSRASRLARHARHLLSRQAQFAAPQPMRDRQSGGDFGTRPRRTPLQ